MNKINKLKAISLALATLPITTGCTINFDETKLKEKLKDFGITIETDGENINITTKDDPQESQTTPVTTTETQNIITTTQYIAPTTEPSTYVTTVGNITTQPVEITTQATTQTTQTTTQTTPVTTQPRELKDIVMESYVCEKNEYKVVDDNYELTLGGQFPTVYSMATMYHPDDEGITHFSNRILELNKDSDFKFGSKIKVPLRLIYYIGQNSLSEIACDNGITLEEICKLNGLKYEDNVNNTRTETDRQVLVKLLPEKTTSYSIQDGLRTFIYANTIINANSLIPFENTYSSTATKAALAFYEEEDSNNACIFIQFNENGTYIANLVAHNVERVYSKNGIPVFEARTELTNKGYAVVSDNDKSYYSTSAPINIRESYHFYRDDRGNVCFTFDNTNLEQFGFTRSDELSDQYVKYPESYEQQQGYVKRIN